MGSSLTFPSFSPHDGRMNLPLIQSSNERTRFGTDSIRNLSQLLKNVVQLLRSTAVAASPSAEDVHQLRVACRRTEVALQILSGVAPKSEHVFEIRDLRRLRRSANGLRDHDVLTERVGGCGENQAAQSLLCQLQGNRSHRQAAFQTFARKLSEHWEQEKSVSVPGRFALFEVTPPDVSFVCVADVERQMRSFVSRFCKAAGKPLRKAERLHRLRIRTKQMRYAIEILGSDLNEEIASDVRLQLETLQDELGSLNDHHTSERLIRRWRAQSVKDEERRLLKELALEERRAFQSSRKKFRKGWTGHRSKQLQRLLKKLSKSVSIG